MSVFQGKCYINDISQKGNSLEAFTIMEIIILMQNMSY